MPNLTSSFHPYPRPCPLAGFSLAAGSLPTPTPATGADIWPSPFIHLCPRRRCCPRPPGPHKLLLHAPHESASAGPQGGAYCQAGPGTTLIPPASSHYGPGMWAVSSGEPRQPQGFGGVAQTICSVLPPGQPAHRGLPGAADCRPPVPDRAGLLPPLGGLRAPGGLVRVQGRWGRGQAPSSVGLTSWPLFQSI